MSVFLYEMTHVEVEQKVKEGAAVIIPMGSVEQHGVHLPLGTDVFVALEISRRVAEKTGSIIAPALWVGFSKEHMAFKGTLTLESDTLLRVVRDVVKSLASHGFRKIVVINAHGGNDAALRLAVSEVNLSLGVDALYIGPNELTSLLPPELKNQLEESMDLHAGILETSIVNLVRPDLVRRNRPSKPKVSFKRHVAESLKLAEGNPQLKSNIIASALSRFDEISDNGALTLADPLNHWSELETERALEEIASKLAVLLEKWKLVEKT
ncbi:MAG: creatininase family protein [Candidatus Jordarchaeales archaeon]